MDAEFQAAAYVCRKKAGFLLAALRLSRESLHRKLL
jgi:hypothetical protein